MKVEFNKIKSGFVVTFYRPQIEKSIGKVGEKVTEKVTENQQKILKAASTNRHITAIGLADIVGISERKIKENIRKLKSRSLLRRIGPDKGGYWEVVEKS